MADDELKLVVVRCQEGHHIWPEYGSGILTGVPFCYVVEVRMW